MAYDNNGARIGASGHFASRITAALIASGQVTKDEAADTFADFTVSCLDVLNGLEGSVTPTPAPARSAEAALGAELGATPAVSQQEVRIIGGSGEVIPPWLYVDAAKAGVTAVYDNRGDLAANPKRPWFKQAEPNVGRDAKGFWPPR